MRQLTETQLLCIKRLKGRKPLWDIADRIGITVEELKQVLKPKK